MIKLETAHIEEVRGIRKLDIDFRKEKFAISGPNGSGESGVIGGQAMLMPARSRLLACGDEHPQQLFGWRCQARKRAAPAGHALASDPPGPAWRPYSSLVGVFGALRLGFGQRKADQLDQVIERPASASVVVGVGNLRQRHESPVQRRRVMTNRRPHPPLIGYSALVVRAISRQLFAMVIVISPSLVRARHAELEC